MISIIEKKLLYLLSYATFLARPITITALPHQEKSGMSLLYCIFIYN